MEKSRSPLVVLINVQEIEETVTMLWIRIFNWYFIGMDVIFAGISLYFVIAVVDFYLIFGVLYCIFWLAIPFYNGIFLTASKTYQKQFITDNYWGLWLLVGV